MLWTTENHYKVYNLNSDSELSKNCAKQVQVEWTIHWNCQNLDLGSIKMRYPNDIVAQ